MKALYFENEPWRIFALKIAQKLHQYAALGPLSPLRYKEVREPQLPNGRWVKVRNRCCGLCGTDLHFMFADIDPKGFVAAMPGVKRKFLGHELVGEIVEIGSEVNGLSVGDRVALGIDWPSCFQMEIDPPCRQCAAGNYMLCENVGRKPLPIRDVGGGFSPFMVMHRTQPYRIPDELSDDAAVLLEPLASAVHGVLKIPPRPGDKVLVLGGGTIGLLTVAACRALAPEAAVWCLVRYPFQARVAEKLGATVIREGPALYARIAEITSAQRAAGYFGNEILLGGFDLIYDSIGNAASFNQALRWTRGSGSVVLIGISFHPGKIDYSPIWCQEVNVAGINCHATEAEGRTSFDVAAEILKTGRIDPQDLITHRFPVDRYKEAVKTFLNKRESQAIKIVIDL